MEEPYPERENITMARKLRTVGPEGAREAEGEWERVLAISESRGPGDGVSLGREASGGSWRGRWGGGEGLVLA